MKKALIITIIISVILISGTGFGMWYWMNSSGNNQKTQLEEDKAKLEEKIKELNDEIEKISKEQKEQSEEKTDSSSDSSTTTPTQKVTTDNSSAEAIIKSYYASLDAHDYETAYSCFADDFKNQNTYEMMKGSWENIKSISIASIELRYTAASARISEYKITETASYIDSSLAATGNIRFVAATDVDYTGNWRIYMMTTSPINL